MRYLAAFIAVFAFPAVAETSGILFDQMPVGCRILGSYSTGERVIDEYAGLSGDTHVMKTHQSPSGRLIRTTIYSRDGLMLRKDWADGKWESFRPASCLGVPGPCSYTYSNADGFTRDYKGRNVRKGNRVINRGGWVGEPAFSPVIETIGL